jgi:hypothetical protein
MGAEREEEGESGALTRGADDFLLLVYIIVS